MAGWFNVLFFICYMYVKLQFQANFFLFSFSHVSFPAYQLYYISITVSVFCCNSLYKIIKRKHSTLLKPPPPPPPPPTPSLLQYGLGPRDAQNVSVILSHCLSVGLAFLSSLSLSISASHVLLFDFMSTIPLPGPPQEMHHQT